jgi:D-alanyl-D-alanine carboxypeptidase
LDAGRPGSLATIALGAWSNLPRRRLLTALAASLALLAGCGSSDESQTSAANGSSDDMWTGASPNMDPMSTGDAAAIDRRAERVLEQAGDQTPGFWIAVADPEKGYYEAAYGKSKTPDTAANIDDIGRIGSVGKTMTATAVLRLVDSGQISLHDSISDLLPDLAAEHPDIGDVTLEQLLGMRSGIPDYEAAVVPKVLDDPHKVWEPSELIDEAFASGKVAKPGTAEYSNTNYTILGEILAAETGESTETAINDVIADAGLTQTALQPPRDTALPDPHSHGYLNEPGLESLSHMGVKAEPGLDVTDYSASWGGAAGGMYSTIGDLESWAATGFGNTLLSKDLGEQRLADTAELNVGVTYALGVASSHGGDWIHHNGQILGWQATAYYNPETGATAALMVNETGSLAPPSAVIAKSFPELLQG